MSTTTVLYDKARKYLTDGTIDFDTDSLRVALLLALYNPRPAAAAWNATSVYAAGTVILVAGRFYEALAAGTSSGAIPSFLGTAGDTTTDNTIIWYCHGYAPPSEHSVYADISPYELPTGGGYTAGGVAATGTAITQVLRSAKFSINNVTWTNATIAARYAAIYKLGTANSVVNPLICYVLLDDTNIDVTLPVPGNFSLFWSDSGLFSL